jgi:hypothetical protein
MSQRNSLVKLMPVLRVNSGTVKPPEDGLIDRAPASDVPSDILCDPD